METGYDTVLKMFTTILETASTNPIAISVSLIVLFVSYGLIKYQLKKAEDKRIDAERNRDLSRNIDSIETDSQNSNEEVRRRLRNRRE